MRTHGMLLHACASARQPPVFFRSDTKFLRRTLFRVNVGVAQPCKVGFTVSRGGRGRATCFCADDFLLCILLNLLCFSGQPKIGSPFWHTAVFPTSCMPTLRARVTILNNIPALGLSSSTYIMSTRQVLYKSGNGGTSASYRTRRNNREDFCSRRGLASVSGGLC